MRVPIRKGGKYTHLKPDPNLTQAKYDELKARLDRLKKARPQLAEEVKKYASDGDFSENAAYQIAKGRLRGVNQGILELEDQLKRAIIIKPVKNTGCVGIGCTVTVNVESKQKTYAILGPVETNPSLGIISYKSPIGAALLGHKIGDRVEIKINDREVEFKIIRIE